MSDLREYAQRHLDSLGITYEQARTDAAVSAADDRYPTARALEILRRLNAQQHRRPTEIASYAPVLPPTNPVVITAAGTDSLTVADHHGEEIVGEEELLTHLRTSGLVKLTATHRALIVDSPRTLATLANLAAQSSDSLTAVQVDWWTQRAQFPGSGAAYVATSAARSRWVTGEHPDAEGSLTTWRTWLGIPDSASDAEACRGIVIAASDGHSMKGLTECARADSRSWADLYRNAHRRSVKDSRRDAALGLTARNQAAEYYQGLRLADPLVAQAALREGHLIQGQVVEHDRRTITLEAATPLSRFRVDDRAEGWSGTVAQADTAPTFAGVISHQSVTASKHLEVRLEDVILRSDLQNGQIVTLRPTSADPFTHGRLRARYGKRLRDSRNWVARGATPPVNRRNVPMDVVIAAASDR